MKWFDREKLLADLAEKLVENIAGILDEYTLIFVIASYFLLIIVANVIGNCVQIIAEHTRALFTAIGKIVNCIISRFKKND